MYISGTHSAHDVITDIAIPFHILKYTDRYKQAKQILSLNPNVKRIVGHSLGGAIMTELIKDNPGLTGIGYGSPNVFPHPRIEYKRHRGDPVSMFNINSTQSLYIGNPHSVSGY
jgi:hypothetical protein